MVVVVVVVVAVAEAGQVNEETKTHLAAAPQFNQNLIPRLRLLLRFPTSIPLRVLMM